MPPAEVRRNEHLPTGQRGSIVRVGKVGDRTRPPTDEWDDKVPAPRWVEHVHLFSVGMCPVDTPDAVPARVTPREEGFSSRGEVGGRGRNGEMDKCRTKYPPEQFTVRAVGL